MLFPPLTNEQKRALKRSGPLDDAMTGLVEHIMEIEDGQAKIANLSTDDFEPMSVARSLQAAVQRELNYALCDRDSDVIAKQFMTSHNTFDVKAFLGAFDAYFEYHFLLNKLPKLAASHSSSPCNSARTDTSFSSTVSTSSTTSDTSTKSASAKFFWKLAKNKSQLFSATHLNLATTIEDRTLPRAVAALEEALLKRIRANAPENTLLLGNIKLWEFKDVMKRSLDLELSSLEASTLFHALDANGDGILSTRELMSYIHGVTARLKLQHKETASFSIPASGNVFSRPVFNRTVVLLSQGINYANQEMPEETLSLEQVQRCIRNRWNVSLTSQQVQCLCHKLSKTHSRCVARRREFLRSYSTDIACCENEGDVMTLSSISGKVLNSFYYQLRLYMAH